MKFINFIVKSSADPNKVSLTIKGIGGALLSLLVIFSGVMNVDVSQLHPILNQIIDTLTLITQGIMLAISGGATLYGLYRKLKTAFILSKTGPRSDITENVGAMTQSNTSDMM